MGLSKVFLSAIMAIIFSVAATSQELQCNFRNLNISIGDSLIKTHTCNEKPRKKIITYAPYYWYAAGKIQLNYGSYSGRLIHGKFEVFDKYNKLIKQGSFDYGLKKGTWIEWFPNGMKKATTSYEKGVLWGDDLLYSSTCTLLSKQAYHKGVLHGKSYFYSKDTTIVKVYKHGKELVKKSKPEKTRELRKVKKKQEPHIKDSTKATQDSIPATWKSKIPLIKKRKNQKTPKNEKI